MGKSNRPSAVRKTLPSTPVVARNNSYIPPSTTTRHINYRSTPTASEALSPLQEEEDHVSPVHPTFVRERKREERIGAPTSGYNGGDPYGPPNFSPIGSRISALARSSKGSGNGNGSMGENATGANNNDNTWGSSRRKRRKSWLEKFPLESTLSSEEMRYISETELAADGLERIKLPGPGCPLDVQEDFSRKIREVLKKKVALSSVLITADVMNPEDMAKSLMSEAEVTMYEAWKSGEYIFDDLDWESMIQNVEDSGRDTVQWENRAKDLNQMYTRSDLTRRHARAWWNQKAGWKPLAEALALVRTERRQGEFEMCTIVLAQMNCHRALAQSRSHRYAKLFLRRYIENVDSVTAMLFQRISSIEDEKTEANTNQTQVIRVD